ncbi:uncharacterized protein isoform X9 [Leptinotarsa decemlineata]|uniref:uncharacterized protein isoform X9 n=1 Tax=Leptinotarsa decemlineata TaxID=7539 RepID=UPI003D30595D
MEDKNVIPEIVRVDIKTEIVKEEPIEAEDSFVECETCKENSTSEKDCAHRPSDRLGLPRGECRTNVSDPVEDVKPKVEPDDRESLSDDLIDKLIESGVTEKEENYHDVPEILPEDTDFLRTEIKMEEVDIDSVKDELDNNEASISSEALGQEEDSNENPKPGPSEEAKKARAIHKSGKYCVVPRCENSVSSTPDKHFFPIPREPNLRQAWQCAMGNTEIVLPIYSYCCEDHFKLEKDTENYMQFKMMGNVKLKMKPKVVPSVFACQKKPSKRLLPDFVAVAEKKAKVEKSVRHQGTQTEKSLYMRDAAVQVDLGEEVEVEEKVKKTPKGGRKKRKIKSK